MQKALRAGLGNTSTEGECRMGDQKAEDSPCISKEQNILRERNPSTVSLDAKT